MPNTWDTWVPPQPVGGLDGVPASWHWLRPALVTAATEAVNQQMENILSLLYLSLLSLTLLFK